MYLSVFCIALTAVLTMAADGDKPAPAPSSGPAPPPAPASGPAPPPASAPTPASGPAPAPASTKCPDVTPMENFDPSKLSGQWFVQMSGAHGVNAKDVKCELRTYTPYDDGSYTDLHVDFLEDDKDSQGSTEDTILVPQSDSPASLTVQHSLLNDTHIIVDTDYNNYAIWVDCVKLGDAAGYMTVVMAAERTPPKDVKTKIQQSLNSTKLNGDMKIMEQTKCRKSA